MVRAHARENAPEPHELGTFTKRAVTSQSPTTPLTTTELTTMASNGSESPSKTKRSRDEMEAEDCVTAPTAQTNDGTVMIAQCDMRNS
jgi:hypothetical protein